MMKITEVALKTGGHSEDDDGVDEDDEEDDDGVDEDDEEDDEDNRGGFKDWWS